MHTTDNAPAAPATDAPAKAKRTRKQQPKGPVYKFAAGGTPPRALPDMQQGDIVRRTPLARKAAQLIDARCCMYLAEVRSGDTVARTIARFTAQGWHRRRETLRTLRDKGMVTVAAE